MIKPRKLKLKSGTKWEVVVYENGRGSKRIKKRFSTKVEAENYIKFLNTGQQPVENLISDNPRDELFGATFETEAEYWLNSKAGYISDGYHIRASRILDALSKDYGTWPISKFDTDTLISIRNELLIDSRSKATVNRWLSVVTSMIRLSYDQGRINAIPFKGFKFFDEFQEEIDFWEMNEIKEFLSFAQNKYPAGSENRWIYVLYLIALNCGPRAGEIYGFKVKDFRFERKNILIERQMNRVTRKLSHTKGKNKRSVPFNTDLQREVKSWIDFKKLDREDLIFTDSRGNPIRHNNFVRRVFKVDVKESGVRKIRFHDLRHTALTHMTDANFNLKLVQTIAGHAEVKTTMKYVHLLGNGIESVADSFSITG